MAAIFDSNPVFKVYCCSQWPNVALRACRIRAPMAECVLCKKTRYLHAVLANVREGAASRLQRMVLPVSIQVLWITSIAREGAGQQQSKRFNSRRDAAGMLLVKCAERFDFHPGQLSNTALDYSGPIGKTYMLLGFFWALFTSYNCFSTI